MIGNPELSWVILPGYYDKQADPGRDRHGRRVRREGISAMADFLGGLDVSVFRALNDLCGSSPTLDRMAVHVEIIKGSLFLGIIGLLWYRPGKEMPRRREILVTMILTVPLSLFVSRIISMLLPFRTRPMYSIGANAPSLEWRPDLEHWSSFPSDNATYLFAIAAGLWLVSRWWGALFGALACSVALARVYLGIHYPSDVLVGALIGVATSVVVNREAVRKGIATPILAFEPRYPPYFYALFFLAIGEVSGGFQTTRRIALAIVHFFTSYSR
jgi:undecaprenyl-diphosphatase